MTRKAALPLVRSSAGTGAASTNAHPAARTGTTKALNQEAIHQALSAYYGAC